MSKVKIVDTTLRDGHQCLWATRMSTAMMRPILDQLNDSGIDVLEVIGAVQFDTCVRHLNDDPWARLRLFREHLTQAPLQAILRSKCALSFGLQPDDMSELWVERLIANGIDRIVAFDGLHDLDNLVGSLLHAKKLGATTIGWLIFSDSPVHTDELYVRIAREFIDRGKVDELMIEDTSGILTPDRARTLIPALKKEIGDMPLGLHTHNTAGLGQVIYIEAAKQGIDSLYTCIAPIADGNAPPAIQTTARNLRHVGFDVGVDNALIDEISRHFEGVAIRDGKPMGQPQDYDAAVFDHQIPGGVMSNFVSQLAAAGLGDRLQEILAECYVVREELGWPIQVTPFSQFIEVQATFNVITGDRYTQIPDEVKMYALGYYGKTLAPVQPDVLDRIIENGSSTVALTPPVPEPVLPGLRKRYPAADDEELMLRHAFPEALVEQMLAAPPDDTDYTHAAQPHVALIEELARHTNLGEISLETADLKLDLRRRPSASSAA